jgi:hypothetical protein
MYLCIEEFASDYPRVNFYTLRAEDEPYSETKKFFNRFREQVDYKDDLVLIAKTIEQIGKTRGAKAHYFRNEDGAEALPPNSKKWADLGLLDTDNLSQPQLRLYCLRLNEEIVILLNGCAKTSQKVQDSPDCVDKFRFANRVNTAFNKMLQDKSIRIRGKFLEMDEPGFFL